MVTKQKTLDKFDKNLKAPRKKIKIYLAGGWFDEYQDKALTFLEDFLGKFKEFDVYMPRKVVKLDSNASLEQRKDVFKQNLKAINNADLVIVSTVGKDMGTLWEAGYAYSKGKDIIYTFFDERFPDAKFNLMLAESGKVCYAYNEINEFKSDIEYLAASGLYVLKEFIKYGGEIE